MTNREKILEIIQKEFPEATAYWETCGLKRIRDNEGNTIDYTPAYSDKLTVHFNGASSISGCREWLDSKYQERKKEKE